MPGVPEFSLFLAGAGAGTVVDLVRWGLAAAAVPVLYRALGEPGQGWGGGTPAVARRAVFAVLGAVLVLFYTAGLRPQGPAGEQGRGFESYLRGTVSFRLHYVPRFGSAPLLSGKTHREEALEELRAAVHRIPTSAHFRRHLAVVLADLGDYAAARTQAAEAMKLLERRDPDRARVERQIWEELFGPDLPKPGRLRELQDRLDSLGMGWTGRVAVLAGWRRLGNQAVPPELRRQVEDEAAIWFRNFGTAGFAALFLLPQAGLVVLGVFGVLVITGAVRPAPRVQSPVGFVLWESFLLMMAAGPVLSLVFGRLSTQTNPQWIPVALLASDLLQLGAVVYLWRRLKSRGLGLEEVGLHRRHLRANIAVGVLATLVLLPVAYLTSILTQLLTNWLFPNLPPPYHPLQGLTATSARPEVRAALFFAAAVGAPFLEELFFRGALYGALRRRLGIGLALLGSSAIFAILHPQLPLGFLPLAVLAAGFAALYEWRQSLVPAMVAHALNNSMAFLLLSLTFPAGG